MIKDNVMKKPERWILWGIAINNQAYMIAHCPRLKNLLVWIENQYTNTEHLTIVENLDFHDSGYIAK